METRNPFQQMLNAGINGFGLMAFLKTLDRAGCKRFREWVPAPTEGAAGRRWHMVLERDDAEPFRVRVRHAWPREGRTGRLLGPSVNTGEQEWAPVQWDDAPNPPAWHLSAGLEVVG